MANAVAEKFEKTGFHCARAFGAAAGFETSSGMGRRRRPGRDLVATDVWLATRTEPFGIGSRSAVAETALAKS